jgi:hypothetical protein
MANEWNFSGKCLTSKKAQSTLNDYLHEHPNLRNEIKNRTGVVHSMEDAAAQAASMNTECNDDADVPSSVVIEDALGIEVSGADTGGSYCVAQAQRQGNHAGLVVGGEDEDVWVWNNGEKWETELPTEDNDN